MRFSDKWLREWVNPPVGAQELAEQLTMAGLEVDALEPVAGAFEGVLVGEVLEVSAHPDADKLRVCQVAIGDDTLQIVCGAPNVQAGMKAPTAVVGAKLPGGLAIKKAKLRGVASAGMLCSARELGLAEDASGLMALPPDAPPGSALADYLQLDDVSIEVDLTPNRGDCLSLRGIAREIGVLNRAPVTGPAMEPVPAHSEARFAVTLAAEGDCPRYAGRVIEGVDAAAATPLWMRERLRRSGVRSLGPVVDVTNYVMLELGQPMHAFDLDRLQDGILVRRAEAGEAIELLDGQRVELEPGSLLIADGSGPVALAGIMGGAATAVNAGTQRIFLESAYFDPVAIAGRARSYGLHTDSSHRFERGVSPELQRLAIERATALLLEICGGRAGPVIEVERGDALPVRTPLALRRARIARVLGVRLADSEVEDILQRLGMAPRASEEGWLIQPPAFRFDINVEEDLIEELARIHGYDRLPVTRPSAALVPAPRPEAELGLRRMRRLLVDRGYREAITYSFVSPALQRLTDPHTPPIPLENPISAELAVMRTSLWPSLLQALIRNVNRQQGRVRLFEYGLRFVPQGEEIEQKKMLAGVVFGEVQPEQWALGAHPADFYDLKGDVEALLALTARPGDFIFEPEQHTALHPGQSARIYRGQRPVGWLGSLHPSLKDELDLPRAALLFELDLQALGEAAIPRFEPLSRFPAIRRDLAIVVDEPVSARAVAQCVRASVPELLREFELFDVYRGKGIDSGRKSFAIGLTLQHLSRTLTDDEVDGLMHRLVETLRSELGASLRE